MVAKNKNSENADRVSGQVERDVRRYDVHDGDIIKLKTDSIDDAFDYYKSNKNCTHIWDNIKQDNIIWKEVIFE